MLNSKHRLLIQRVVVGAMLLAILGFGVIRYFRVEEAAKSKSQITYDSDLHDKSGHSTSIPIANGSNESYPVKVAFELDRTKQLLDSGKEDDAIKVLDNIMSGTDALANDTDDKALAESQKISERVSEIEQSLFTGHNDQALKEIVALRDSLSSQSLNQ